MNARKDEIGSRLTRLALLSAPVVTLGVAKLLMPAAGPAAAAATPTEAPGELATLPDQLPETLWPQVPEDAGAGDPPPPSPFFLPRQRTGEAPVTSGGLDRPEFALTAVLEQQGTASAAVIDGRIVRPGHELTGGWRVESIDPAARTVGLVHPTGERLTLELQMPRLGAAAEGQPRDR